MKLIYIANIRLPTEKAHGIQIMNMCTSFALLGNTVELIVPNRINTISIDPFEYYSTKKNFTIRRLWCIDAVRFGSFGFKLQSITFTITAFLYTLFSSATVVYGRDEFVLLLLSLTKKVIWETHTGSINMFAKLLLKKRVPIVAITGGLKNFYMQNGGDKRNILVAHDAVDIDQFPIVDIEEARTKLSMDQNRFIVSYIGKLKTIGKSKGVEDLIQAFSEFQKNSERALLLIVGLNSDEIGEVEILCSRAGIPKNAYKTIGHVPHTTVPTYVSASDVLIMNYPNTGHFREYMSPLKLFEYMASGRAIVASDLPSIREVIDENSAYIIPPEDVPALSGALMRAYHSPDERKKLGFTARTLVIQNTWVDRAGRIMQFVANLKK